MARDEGLEELIRDDLRDVSGVTEKAMFGGWAWLLHGKLLCGSRDLGMLVRLGKGNVESALKVKNIVPAVMGGRTMAGWVRLESAAMGDQKLRKKLLVQAVEFVKTLPQK